MNRFFFSFSFLFAERDRHREAEFPLEHVLCGWICFAAPPPLLLSLFA